MNLLLDTHVLIWFINGDNKLFVKAKNLIKNINNKCYVSIASIWEIALKISLGKLDINGGFDEISSIMDTYEFELLPISYEHIQQLLKLEYHHRDPFDRIIISQGIVENVDIISIDSNFRLYPIKIIWK